MALMKSNPFFSIIIPAKNSEAFIHKALKSVSEQTFRDFEVIVIDDNSCDSTVKIVNGFQKQFDADQLKILYSPPDHLPGPGAVRNAGVAAARGKTLAFLDADDFWLPDHLENAHKVFCSYPEVVLYYALGQSFKNDTRDNLNIIGWGPDQYDGGPFDARSFIFKSDPMQTSVVCALTQAVKNVSGFEERLVAAQDWWLWICLSRQGLFYFNNKVEGYYRVSDDSHTGCGNEVNSIISSPVFADVAIQSAWMGKHEKRYLYNIMIQWTSDRLQHYIRVCDTKVLSKICSHIYYCQRSEKLIWLRVTASAFVCLIRRAYRSFAVRSGLLSKEEQFRSTK